MTPIRRDQGTGALEPFERGFFDWPLRHPFETFRRFLDEDMIKVDEFMQGDELVVRAELPGVDPERDVDISIVDGALCIRAERRQEEKMESGNVRRSELRYGTFSRTLPLPSNAKEDDIKARYHDGILEVRAPVAHNGEKRSKVPIERG